MPACEITTLLRTPGRAVGVSCRDLSLCPPRYQTDAPDSRSLTVTVVWGCGFTHSADIHGAPAVHEDEPGSWSSRCSHPAPASEPGAWWSTCVATEDFFTLRNNSRHKNPSFCHVQFSVVSVHVASTYTDSTSNFRLYGSVRAIRIAKPHFVFIFSQTRDTMPCPSRDLSMVNIGWAKL